MRPGIIILSVVLAAWASAIARPQHARAYQHIGNGGFESGLSGWSAAPGVAIAIASASPAEGSASAKVIVGAFAARLDYTVTGALPAGAYAGSLSARGTAGATISLNITPAGQPRLEIASGTTGATWNAIAGQVTLKAAANATLSIIIEAPPGAEVYLDSVRLDGAAPVTLTPTPTRTPTPQLPAQATPAASVTTSGATTSSTPAATATPAIAVDVIAPSLRNAGFEELDATGVPFAWEKFGGVLSSDGRARSGSRAARLDSNTSSTKWLHQAVTVNANQWYALEAWLLHDDAGVASAFLRISWYASGDGSGTAIDTVDSTTKLDAPSPGYRHLTTGGVQAPADARSARARILLAPRADAAASILVDDAWFGTSAPPQATATPTIAPSTAVAGASNEAPSEQHRGAQDRARSAGAPAAPVNVASTGVTTDIVINEILYDPDSAVPDGDAEWAEIYNAGDVPVDLTGWSIRDGTSADDLPPIVVPARAFAIIAASDAFRAAYPNVDVPIAVVGARIGNGLGNDGDSLTLIDPAGRAVDAVSWGEDSSALAPSVEDVPAGHSIEREFAGVDSNTADDFIDNEQPSPGFAYARPTDPKPQKSARSLRIIEGAGASEFGWVPWLLAAGSAAACAAMFGWRAFERVRAARHP